MADANSRRAVASACRGSEMQKREVIRIVDAFQLAMAMLHRS